jgi:type VI secretion system protein ImpH
MTKLTPPKAFENWIDEEQPWKAGFLSTLRTIAARSPELPPPGIAERPIHEAFRLGQRPHMTFAPREIASIKLEGGKVNLTLFGLGVWGSQGALPLHWSELAYSRTELHDHTFTDFIDLFHHRALAQFYRAWFVSQDTASLDRKDDERFAFYIGSLIGLDPNEINHPGLPPHARLATSAHLVREARNPEGLVGALKYYFGIPVNIEEFAEQWILLETQEQSQLGNHRSALNLGDGAILGNTVMDRQHKFHLLLGPLNLKQYLRFSPWGQDLPILREWVRHFVGLEYAWGVHLMLAAEEVPQATLDGTHQLGYATWLERSQAITPVTGMSFEPEMCHR